MSDLRCGTCGQKDSDYYFDEGFDYAIKLVDNIFARYKAQTFDAIWADIEIAVDRYKNGEVSK